MTEPEVQPILTPEQLVPNSVMQPPKKADMAKKKGDKYLDPDTGEVATFEIPPPPVDMGRDWTMRELRSMKRHNYPRFPHVAPERAAAEEREKLVSLNAAAEAAAKVRENAISKILRMPSSNVDKSGMAHFLLTYKNTDTCGGCHGDWPCEAAQAGARNDMTFSAEPGSARPVSLEKYAQATGQDPEQLDARLRRENPDGYERSQH